MHRQNFIEEIDQKFRPFEIWLNQKMPKQLWATTERIFTFTAWALMIGALNALHQKSGIAGVGTVANFLFGIFFVGILATMLQTLMPPLLKLLNFLGSRMSKILSFVCTGAASLLIIMKIDEFILSFVTSSFVDIFVALSVSP